MDEKTKVKGILIVSMLVGTSLIAVIAFMPLDQGSYTYKLGTFQSYNDLLAFLKKRYDASTSHGYGIYAPNVLFQRSGVASTDKAAEGGSLVPDYSKTNVQVEGVDEPDIVKTDGTYLYLVENGRITVVKAYPFGQAAVLSRITFNNSTSITNIFISGDTLVVFGTIYASYGGPYPLLEGDVKIPESPSFIWRGSPSKTLIALYDVTDRTNPVLAKEVKIDGYYFDARMIDKYVYVVASEYTNYIYYALDANTITLNIPQISVDNVSRNISAGDIYYVDVPELSDAMTHVVSIDLDTKGVAEKSFLLGSSETMYVSKNAIFLTSAHYPYYPMPLRSNATSSESNQQTTIIHKISINTGNVTYVAQGEVPGRILNQFSMDEYKGYFRIATTVDAFWGSQTSSSNNVYILDATLKQVGKIENIAPGESIYAARFMGDRGFLVTFVQVDPLFAIDLSDPSNPRILGELKIPGYSNYLQPYDENHIIGIGKEVDPTIDANKVHTPGAIYYTAILGLKIALFDVTDVEHPVEEAKVVIGDRGTDSPALYDHKALLFDREKNLLVLPVSVYEIPQEVKDRYVASNGTTDLYGTFTFQGAYVYRLSLENGFELKGRITHQTAQQQNQTFDTWYWGSSNTDITRALYIGDTLYTISESMIKMNSLTSLDEQNSLSLT